MSNQQELAQLWQNRFAHPKYWLTWFGLGFIRLITHLPSHFRYKTQSAIGLMLYHLAKKRRHIASTNIQLAFPELTPDQQQQRVKQVFIENTSGLLEIGLILWGNREKLNRSVKIKGGEHIEAALEKNKGVIMVGAHYSSLDLGGYLFSLFYPVDVLYRPHDNALFNHFLKVNRATFCQNMIEKDDMRAIIRCIKKGHIFWYPADQDYGPKHSVFAPFFNVNAATINVTSRLAKMNQSPVVIFGCHRTAPDQYEINISEPLPQFPSDSPEADAAQVNLGIENEIRRYPAQYMWVHRRFKTRPDGEPSIY